MKRKTLRERAQEYANEVAPAACYTTFERALVHAAFIAGGVSERTCQADARRKARKGKGEK